MLRLHKLDAFYDRTQVLHGIDLRVDEARSSGWSEQTRAGKSSTLLSISGIRTRTSGEIWWREADRRSPRL